jgi:L-alanine-DL-glutamate epimerase-like enolase superfamily enzyme
MDITVEMFHRHIAPAVIGARVNDPSRLLDRVIRYALNYKMMGVQFNKALAGLDSAAWDVVGKRMGKSVCELIAYEGGLLHEVPVYASSLSRTIAPAVLAEKLALLRSKHGIKAFKVKIGKRMGRDQDEWEGRTLDVVTSARKALGEEALLAVDANGAYETLEKAKETNRQALRPNKVWFFEEPFPWFQYQKYSQLHKEKLCRVAGGEQEFRPDVWEEKVSSSDVEKPWHISQPDIGYCGGMSNAIAIARASLFNGLDCMPHSPQGDLSPVMCWHLLCACAHEKARNPSSSNREEYRGHLELGCVDDGLAQVTLNQDGLYECKAFTPALRVRNGKFSLALPHDCDGGSTSTSTTTGFFHCKGWGITMKQSWVSSAVERKFSRKDQFGLGGGGASEAPFWGGSSTSATTFGNGVAEDHRRHFQSSSSSNRRAPVNPHAVILAVVVAIVMLTQHGYSFLVRHGILPNPDHPPPAADVTLSSDGEEWGLYNVLLSISFIVVVALLALPPDII